MAESTRQGAGIIYLGTPANPTLYTARILQGPSEWQRVAIAFIATDPTVRISLLGQAGGPGNTVEYDGIRFLPPGRNPVLLMAAIFARFLPQLSLDAASVQAAADRRNEWLFSGYIPDPGRTDQLLTKMSQECFCTLVKDLDGVYKITADDPDHSPILHLESQQDLHQDTLALEHLPMEEVYTDFYLWYQRVTTQVTTSQAGQYAAVLYATPDASISQYSELQTLCQQAAEAFATRRRFDFYSDFIADPATADLLLARFVRQYSVLRQDVTLQAALPALPLSLTDHVAVHAPLLGPQPFVGALRRSALAVSAQAPGLGVALTLRQSGLVRGAWETWDAAGGGPESYPPGTPRVRETWPDTGTPAEGPWYWHSRINGNVIPALLWPAGTVSHDLFASQGELDVPGVPTLRSPDPPDGEPGSWDVATPDPVTGTAGMALGTAGDHPGQDVERAYSALQRTGGACEIWSLSPTFLGSPSYGCALPAGRVVTAMSGHDFSDGNGVHLYIGTASGEIYLWNLNDPPTLRLSEGSTRRFRAIATHPVTGALWAACDNAALSSTGNVVMYQLTASGFNTTVPGGGGNRQTCNMVTFNGQLWAAFGVQDQTEISLWALAETGPWVKQYTFTGLTDQLPGCLAVFDGRLYLGRLSTTATPVLALWRSDASGLTWEVDVDFATFTDEGGAPDQNTAITALGVASGRGKLYAATGCPYAGPRLGARVYVTPTPD